MEKQSCQKLKVTFKTFMCRIQNSSRPRHVHTNNIIHYSMNFERKYLKVNIDQLYVLKQNQYHSALTYKPNVHKYIDCVQIAFMYFVCL